MKSRGSLQEGTQMRLCTYRSYPKYAGAKFKRAVQKGLPGLFPSRKRVMSVKGTECSELCVVMYVKPSVVHMKGDKGLVYTYLHSVHWVHASQKVDVRDILDCDYKLIAQITGTAVLPDEKCLSSKTEACLLLSMFSENCFRSDL